MPRDLPDFCTGCVQCVLQGEEQCPHRSRVAPLEQLLDAADVLIFTTPTYVYHTTGSMKAFLDHFAYRWMPHRPDAKMFAKQGVSISTAAGGGMKSACRDVCDSLRWWGVGRVYAYGTAVYACRWEEVSDKKRAEIDRRTTRLAAQLQAHAGRVRPSLGVRLRFFVVRMLQKKQVMDAGVDRTYWQAQGWLTGGKPW